MGYNYVYIGFSHVSMGEDIILYGIYLNKYEFIELCICGNRFTMFICLTVYFYMTRYMTY